MIACDGKCEKAPAPASLDDLIDAVEIQCDSVGCYLDRKTGEIYRVSEEAFRIAEDDAVDSDSVPDWQQEEIE